MKSKKISFILATIIALFFGVTPNALASTRFSPLEIVFAGISNFFQFDVFAGDERLQIGLIRFLLWIVLFAILFFSANRFVFNKDRYTEANEGRKMSIVVSLVISLISAIFLPEGAVIAIGTGYSAMMFAILSLTIAGLAIFFAFKTLNSHGEKDAAWKDILGLFILIIAFMIMNVISTILEATI